MKARIIKDIGDFYVGEVYATWSNWLLRIEWTGWRVVTSRCMTKLGARIELERWKQNNFPKEFEI